MRTADCCSHSLSEAIEGALPAINSGEYVYAPLKTEYPEIRLLSVLSGRFNDPLLVRIHHSKLTTPEPQPSQRMSLDWLQSNLPKGWEAFETSESKILFANGPRHSCSWTHPNPHVRTSHYAQTPIYPPPDFQPQYEALSYTWGDSVEMEEIFVQNANTLLDRGQYSISTLHVRRNLVDILRYLRHNDRHITLWIDAICINQNDVSEKSHQIRLMRNVYMLAQRVIVW